MKKPTFFNYGIIVVLLSWGMQLTGQNYTPFTTRFDEDLRGDIVLIGNNILGPNNDAFNENDVYNHTVDMRYIDIDNDNSTFSSSSADLEIPNPNCYRIIHASLYWGAVTRGDEPITEIKFKGPSGSYNDITGSIIYDAQGVATGNAFPYSCYADVTDLVTSMGTQIGTYTVANVSSAQGRTADLEPFNGTGYSAGWSLFVVYEDPTLPGKSITSFDGFSAISSSVNLDIPVSGFRTVPAPTPVRANFAFAALEGDKPILNDRLVLNGVPLSASDRDPNNFFNSSVTRLDATAVTNRNPNSTNTLGFDTGVMVVPNPGNSVIANDATSATVRLESDQDVYFEYFFALAVDIIQPDIVLTKIVEDDMGNNIGGQEVALGTQLNYVIGFQNTGNDDATDTMIRDILPINIVFNYPEDIEYLPPGVTVRSYDPSTRELIFDIDDSIVEENDPVLEIRFKVRVVDTCSELSDACANLIENQAFATYKGTLNPNFLITDDPSFSTNTGCLLTPSATNFIAEVNDCTFNEEVVLCGDSTTLTAADGYESYSWSKNPNGNPVIGTGQSITVTETDIYYVFNTAPAPCRSTTQEFNVTLFSGNTSNPIIPYADEVVTCPNDGKLLPNIFLCGDNDERFIQTNITDSSSMIWEKLDESSCDAVENEDCANEDDSCVWNQIATGSDYLVDAAGQYRLTINYEGGCFNQFYFNVYENILVPTISSRDIICDTLGEIVVGGVPNGYEFSLDGSNFQSSNIFTITQPDIYTVFIRQVGVETNPCIFEVPDVQIRERDFTGSAVITQPFCNGDKGSVKLAALDARPQYYYSISNGGTLINSVGPIADSDYTFPNLNTGSYTVTISTDDGCIYTEDIDIVEPPLLTVTAGLTKPLTCQEGEITIYPVGGTPPYFYFINSDTEFQNSPIVTVTNPGTFEIMVVDSNNCVATTSIVVEPSDGPEFTVDTTDILCSDSNNSGSITINVSNANGNNLQFSIDDGTNFYDSNVFTGLAAGDYSVVVRFLRGQASCDSVAEVVTIIQESAIEGIAELTSDFTCDSDGTITVTGISGGTAPYTYSIDGVNFQSNPEFNNLQNGTYTITIKDSSDCTFITEEITIDPLDGPTDLTFSSTEVSCPSNVSDVAIETVENGIPPFEYQIVAPAVFGTAYQTSNTFQNLAPGTYTFQVKDANNCVYTESYTIEGSDTISVIGQTITDESCFNAADGSAEFTISGTSNFSYSINGGNSNPGSPTIIITDLTAGTYTILISDLDSGCTATTSVSIDGPEFPIDAIVSTTPIGCNSDASVTVEATGGWGGFTYVLTMPDNSTIQSSNGIFTGLTQAGNYSVDISDSRGCLETVEVQLDGSETLAASISTDSDLCYDGTNGATLSVDVSNGTPPYEFRINGGSYGPNNTFTNLVPGIYIIDVRDSQGCDASLSAVTIENQLTINTILDKALDCTSDPDARVIGTFSGGYAPYTYAVSINGGAFNDLGATISPFNFTTSTAGNYQFQITDAQGCAIQSNIISVEGITLPAITSVIESSTIQCHGDENASLEITIDNTSGTPPFIINVFNNTTGTDYGSQTTGLAAGDYTVTITDANSCTDTETISITEPQPLAANAYGVDITCTPAGTSQGSVVVDNVSGGTAPYTYYVTGTNGYSESEINPTGSTSTTFDVVDFGIYQVNIVDDNGCSIIIQDILVASPPNDLDISIDTNADCINGGQAIVSIGTATVGAGPFFFSIYQGPASIYPNPPGSWIPEDSAGSKSATFNNLIPGVTYTFIVHDVSSGCSYYETAPIPIPTNSTLSIDTLTAKNITCTGSADGSVSITINSIYGSPVDINYEVYDNLSLSSTGISGNGTIPANGSLNINDLGPLPFGNYIVIVEETSGANSGCGTVSIPFNITESVIEFNLEASIINNANCNSNSGVINAIASEGTAPYSYQITTSSTPPSVNDPNWGNASTFNVDANTYYVHGLDANGCIKTVPIVMPEDPTPEVILNATNECTAVEGSYEIEVDLSTAGVPPYTFSIDGGAFQVSAVPFTLNNLSSGTHTVELRDANGCGNLVSITMSENLDLFANATILPSCIDNDGEITVNANGGTGSYSYSINPNPASISLSSNVFSGVPSGDYVITVTDNNNGCTATTDINVSLATPVTFNTEVGDVSCVGDNDGFIRVELPTSNDNPIYTFELLAPNSVGPQTSNVFNGLAAGTYTVRVTSGRGCTAEVDVVIGAPDPLSVSGNVNPFICNPDNTFDTTVLSISGSGGTTPYSYSIDGVNFVSDNTFEITDTGSSQSITMYVKDSNGCIDSDSINVDPLPLIDSAVVTLGSPINCNNTGTIVINASGGSGNYTYQMLPDGAPQASNSFDINAPGDYYFQVNDQDSGCYFVTTAFTVQPYETMDVMAAAISDIDCFGSADGVIEFTVNGYNGGFEYQVINSSGVSIIGPVSANTSTNPVVITNVPAGNYSVSITQTDHPFCNAISNVVTITSPTTPLLLTVNETSSVSCDNGRGTITAIAQGGWGNYEYELSGMANVAYSTNGIFRNLEAGNYTVNVRDSQGCIVSESIELTIPPAINATVTASATDLACFGDTNASITVSNISGGQGSNYSYTLHRISPIDNFSGPQTSPVFNGLGAGSYEVLVTDALGCEFISTPITINEPEEMQIDLVKESTQTCTSQTTLTLSATGGTAPYSYSDNATFNNVLGSFNSSVSFPVSPGSYQFYVRDSNGCVANVSNEITIDPLPSLEVVLDATNAVINCAGEETGVIVAIAQGGLGNYTYTLQDGSGNEIPDAVQNSPGVFSNLAVGTYTVYVESGDCLATSESITITEPSSPLIVDLQVSDISCTGTNNGSVEIIASGGNGVIKYAISPQMDQFFDDPIFNNLSPGDYSVIVQDELGCYELLEFTISEPEPVVITIVPDSILPEVCEGDGNGEFSIEVSGGNLPYSVSLDSYDGPYTQGADSQTLFSFTDLEGGDHTVFVRDSQGCESEWNISFPDAVVLNPEVEVAYECTENALNNTVTVIVDSSVDPAEVDYSLDGGPYQSSNVFNNVPEGSGHIIDVRHTNGCVQTTLTFNISSYEPIELSLVQGEINEIIAQVKGGTPEYEFFLNGESQGSESTFVITESGEYTVTVVDANGCTAMATGYFEFIDICIPNYFTPNGDGILDEWAPGCAQQYEDLTFDIFDRYGRKVAQYRQGETWDGKYRGYELPTGDYWFVVRLNANNDGREFVGHFTLYR